MSLEQRHLHLRGALGAPRTETWNGKEYLIVPVVALCEGVIHAVNAATPERVTAETLRKAAHSWNGRPLVLGHPVRGGTQVSANDARILEEKSFGAIFNSRVEGKRLLMDAWVDLVQAERVGGVGFAKSLRDGKMCEVSVGAFVATDNVSGEWAGKPYKATWIETAGDHLAFLPGGRGACSVEMGCGAHRAMSYLVTAEGLELEKPSLWRQFRRLLKKDCEACNGAGNKDGNPCEVCDGDGELKVAAGARHSVADRGVIQGVHDHAVTLGAECALVHTTVVNLNPKILESEKLELKAACRCEGESEMTKEERIATLLKNEHNQIKNIKVLEAADEETLAVFEAQAKQAGDLKAMADKAVADKKVADDKAAEGLKAAKTIEDRLTAAEAQLVVANANQITDDMRSLVDEKRAADKVQHTTLVAQLKAAQTVYSEERLKAMPIAQLQEIAALAKIETPNYSGRLTPRVAEAGDAVKYEPPNSYEQGLKALKAMVN